MDVKRFDALHDVTHIFLRMVWIEQFQLKKFKFVYDHPEQIVLCQWQTNTRTSTAYLLFRMAFLTFFLGTYYTALRMAYINVSCHCIEKITQGTVFVYYTMWSEIFCLIAAISSCLITTTQYIQEDDYEEEPEKCVYECRIWFRIHMVLYTLALDSSLALVLGYFGYVYFNEKKMYRGISYVIHLWSGMVMLLDFVLSSMPTHLFHVYLNVCVCLSYGFFTWAYYMLGGKNFQGGESLYKILDWKDDPWMAVCATLASVITFVAVRAIVFSFSVIRDTIFYKYYYLDSDDEVRTRNFVVVN